MLATKERLSERQYTVEEFERLYLSPENSNHYRRLLCGEWFAIGLAGLP